MRPVLTAAQLKRAKFDRLLASLPVRQHTSLTHVCPVKQKPATGVFASM